MTITKVFIINKKTREAYQIFIDEKLDFNTVFDMINKDIYEVEHIEVKDDVFIGVNNKDDANYLNLPWF